MKEIAKPEAPQPRIIDPALKGKMLPGIAAITMFLLLLTLLNVFAALNNAYGAAAGKHSVLGVCTLLVIGLFGLMRMQRFGWAIVCGGCILLSGGDFYFFRQTHVAFFLLRGFFMLVFFLYLVRPEVRDRMR
jgi:hypothetical protein